MSGECDQCGEHALECKCCINWISLEDQDVPIFSWCYQVLFCDSFGYIYLGYRDDEDDKYYEAGEYLTELHNIMYWAYVPEGPIKKKLPIEEISLINEPIITDDGCVKSLNI